MTNPAPIPQPPADGPEYIGDFPGFAVFLLVPSVALVCFGLYRGFVFSDASKYVGGDAYNYLILAVQGTALIIAGLTLGVFATISVLGRILAVVERRQ